MMVISLSCLLNVRLVIRAHCVPSKAHTADVRLPSALMPLIIITCLLSLIAKSRGSNCDVLLTGMFSGMAYSLSPG